MSAQQLFDSFKNYLQVTTSIPQSSYPGDFLEVPETFKLKVRVVNTAPRGALGDHPYITFNNVRVLVNATPYATPIDVGDSNKPIPVITVPLGDPILSREDDGDAFIDMKATMAMPFWRTDPEKIAGIVIIADVDQDSFFNINKPLDVFHNINAD